MIGLDTMILLAQTACVFFLALWLTTGVRDNIQHPVVNEMFTAEVMDLTRLRAEYPALYAVLEGRRITSRPLQKLAFRLVVAWELLAAIALWVGFGAMALALFAAMPADAARALAIGGVLMFTTTWALFLIVGNHFSYWLCHDAAQNTHYQMTLWGLGTLIFLAI